MNYVYIYVHIHKAGNVQLYLVIPTMDGTVCKPLLTGLIIPHAQAANYTKGHESKWTLL